MKNLLIVEDEKLIRQGIKVMVQRSGVPIENIYECSNGEQALALLKEREVDVMFTDIRMPKMDGMELVTALQELPRKPMVVAVSGYDDFSYAVGMMRMGAREYLLKPVEREKVREILEKLNRELEEGAESQRQDRYMGCQQLKYAIMNNRMTESEQTLLEKQYGGGIFAGQYYAVCLNNTKGITRAEEGEAFIYLSDVNDSELYLVGENGLESLLQEELRGRFAGISRAHRGLGELKDACREAYQARKTAFYRNKAQVRFEELKENGNPGLTLKTHAMEQLVQMLGTDKYEEALKQLGRIFRNASLGSYEPAEMEEALRVLLDGVKKTYAAVLKTDEEGISPYYEIYAYPGMEEYGAEVSGWLTHFCEVLNSCFDDYKNKQKIQQAIGYIRENFDKDLNMAVVSNEISMNYSLFSYVFKQYTGCNFVNYLKEIRINEAKRLLEETDMKVVDISLKVGYENEKHFMKVFKSACGVSPTEYRKNMLYKQ